MPEKDEELTLLLERAVESLEFYADSLVSEELYISDVMRTDAKFLRESLDKIKNEIHT